MNSDCTLNVAAEFSRFPGGRLRKHGPKSGEEFRDDILLPKLRDCEKLTVDLTGAVGYAASFLDESFGELGKRFGLAEVRKRLTLVAKDDPVLVEVIWEKVKRAAQEK